MSELNDATVKNIVGEDSYEQMRQIIRTAFPASHSDGSQVTDAFVDSVIHSMWEKYNPLYANLGIPPINETHPTAQAVHKETMASAQQRFSILQAAAHPRVQLYWGHATHHRTLKTHTATPMQSEFVGNLPKARVSLPSMIKTGVNDIIATPLGEVYLRPPDHKLVDIQSIAAKYGSTLNYTPERVDLITPPRYLGSRFAAVSLYLGYRQATDAWPSFYMLEGGTATGDAKMIYFAQTIETTMTKWSYYQPTPFSSANDTYVGTLEMTADGQHPLQVVVKSTQPKENAPYITVTLNYQPVTRIDPLWPVELTFQAACRVALIAQTMGVSGAVPAQPALAELAKAYDWVIQPTLNPTTGTPST